MKQWVVCYRMPGDREWRVYDSCYDGNERVAVARCCDAHPSAEDVEVRDAKRVPYPRNA